jgi:hypothetical protein
MTHLAIWEALDGREDPEWGELVSDEEYAEPARTTPQS